MNDLIDTVFGDPYITLNCDSGECLPRSLIPGYEVRSAQVPVTSFFIAKAEANSVPFLQSSETSST
jgi:hypothetical protein